MSGSICIIPARGGSVRIPRKNIKLFHGKPIIAYSIETARNSGLFDKVYVSTEDQEISDISNKYGAEVVQRAEHLADNVTGTQEVVKQALHSIGEMNIFQPAFIPTDRTLVCCLYATSPLLTDQDLRRGRDLLLSNRLMQYSFSIGTPLHDAGNFYWGFAESFLHDVPVHAEYSIMVPVENFQDINTPEDWALAEKKYGQLHR